MRAVAEVRAALDRARRNVDWQSRQVAHRQLMLEKRRATVIELERELRRAQEAELTLTVHTRGGTRFDFRRLGEGLDVRVSETDGNRLIRACVLASTEVDALRGFLNRALLKL